MNKLLIISMILLSTTSCFLKTPPTAQGLVQVKYSTGLIDTIEYKVFSRENVIICTGSDGIMYLKGDVTIQHLPIGAVNARILTKDITNE